MLVRVTQMIIIRRERAPFSSQKMTSNFRQIILNLLMEAVELSHVFLRARKTKTKPIDKKIKKQTISKSANSLDRRT